MKNLTFLKIVFILISASFISSCAETEMTYDVFLEKHLTASGGAAAISNVQNIDIDLIITEGDNAMNAHYRANRDGQMRIDVFIGGERVFTEALSSANDGWQLDGGETEAKPLSADGKLALQKGIHFNLYGLHEMPDLGYKIDFLGSQNLNDVDYWAVDITSPEGKIERRFFDKKTFLKSVTIDESALHVDVDPTKSLNAS
ncbi:MAG: hypothetical protein HOM01_09880, partial [Kordiimonadaceae bacterium]|nr:hypothetical protein [Kordiimonadaceae bacterium]